MWQFAEATRGWRAPWRADVPVVSEREPYNETEGKAILPDWTVAVVGLFPDVARPAGVFRTAGHKIAVLGETSGQPGGSGGLR